MWGENCVFLLEDGKKIQLLLEILCTLKREGQRLQKIRVYVQTMHHSLMASKISQLDLDRLRGRP